MTRRDVTSTTQARRPPGFRRIGLAYQASHAPSISPRVGPAFVRQKALDIVPSCFIILRSHAPSRYIPQGPRYAVLIPPTSAPKRFYMLQFCQHCLRSRNLCLVSHSATASWGKTRMKQMLGHGM